MVAERSMPGGSRGWPGLASGAIVALAWLVCAGVAQASAGGDTPEAVGDQRTVVDVGGALRFNYFVKSWPGEEGNRTRGGDLRFDMLRLDFDAQRGPVRMSAAYRIYDGYSMLQHGWIGWQPADGIDLQVGLHQVPFGILPLASHCWWFDLGFYLGFERDLDLGLKGIFELGPFDVQLGLYKNADGQFTGSSLASARYSYDVVPVRPEASGAFDGIGANRETNQINLRGAYTATHGAGLRTELGLSAQAGQLHNADTDEMGWHAAGAGHVVSVLGPLDVQLMALYYTHAPADPAGADDRVVVMGAFDAPYRVASRGVVVHANVAYTLRPDHPVVEELSFYDDYSVVLKQEQGFADSHMNVLGTRVSTHHIHCFIELAFGRNHPWIGPDSLHALAEGEADAAWHTRFNINLGYYF